MDTIRNISLIGKVRNETASLFEQAERAGNAGGQLHQLDVDIMLAQTRKIYEYLLQLETGQIAANREGEKMRKYTPEPVVITIPAKVEAEAEQKAFVEPTEEIQPKQPLPEETIVPEVPEKVQEADYLWDQPTAEKPQPEEPVFVEKTIVFQAIQSPRSAESEKPKLSSATVSTLDLFGESAPERIADKLSVQKDNSIATRIERSKISDLRQAIGINEKFLFINDLFEGNITQYNNAIDELNGFQSFNGARTYFIELSVLYRWPQESIAKEKLMQLIERKFED
ncbi:MAG: hypothetical protein KG029_15180 [Bacteroidetes bacterium]|jgi:hypothetical protein|nr:hypothetical protein [Bacteroidota bacterium]